MEYVFEDIGEDDSDVYDCFVGVKVVLLVYWEKLIVVVKVGKFLDSDIRFSI